MKRTGLLFLFNLLLLSLSNAQNLATPDKIYGQLFIDVQMQKIFPDGKTFVDCIPKRKPTDIMYDYGLAKGPKLNLKKFVEDNFELPVAPQLKYVTQEKDVVSHIKNLWPVLRRNPDKIVEGSSLLPLPYAYIVPGGRFGEIFYWDSYFTMLGLKESGENEMIENMIKNFAYLIETYGHIPNGNRTYFLSRSQPPFFSLMVDLLAEIKGDSIYKTYLPALEKEYSFWMEGSDKIKTGTSYKSIVRLKDSTLLNRYWDESTTPRQESYREDILTAEKSKRNKIEMYQHLRSAATSGWDFSSRWFADSKNIITIQTTDFIPVDLNALLYNLELVIAKAKAMQGDESAAGIFRNNAEKRMVAVDKYCWNKTLKYYVDYNVKKAKPSDIVTPAGMYPFCFFPQRQGYLSVLGRQASEAVKAQLLQPGGIVTSIHKTGEQWDAPNGWAPLQWMTIWGLDRSGQRELAREAAERWIKLNVKVFEETGKLMEKYDVMDIQKPAGGGEYPSQDGFGWTNGVLLKLISLYGVK